MRWAATVQRRLASIRDTPESCQSSQASLVNLRCISTAVSPVGTHTTTTNSRNALFLNAGTSRYVFTTDVSVNEVQAFIRDLVRVLGWFGPLDRYGR